MKPYVICHLVASLDGRTPISRWQPEDALIGCERLNATRRHSARMTSASSSRGQHVFRLCSRDPLGPCCVQSGVGGSGPTIRGIGCYGRTNERMEYGEFVH
jgi:hypothetical protein